MRNFLAWLAALLLVLVAIWAGPVLAQAVAIAPAPGVVEVPYGAYVDEVSKFLSLGSVIGAVVLWVCRKIPGQLGSMLMAARVDQVIDKGITYALNAVANATKGKVLSVNVGNQVLAEALNYILTHAPATLVKWMGGEDMVAQKIVARLQLEPMASVIAAPGNSGGIVITGPAIGQGALAGAAAPLGVLSTGMATPGAVLGSGGQSLPAADLVAQAGRNETGSGSG